METLYDEVRTAEIFNYHILAFEKKWAEIFGDPMKFKVMLDKTGKLHLVSTKSMHGITGIKSIRRKVKSQVPKKSDNASKPINGLENG